MRVSDYYIVLRLGICRFSVWLRVLASLIPCKLSLCSTWAAGWVPGCEGPPAWSCGSTRRSQGNTWGTETLIPEPDTQGRASSSLPAGPRPCPEADNSTFFNRHEV